MIYESQFAIIWVDNEFPFNKLFPSDLQYYLLTVVDYVGNKEKLS